MAANSGRGIHKVVGKRLRLSGDFIFTLSATVGVTNEEGYISRMGNIMGTAQGLGVFMGRAWGGEVVKCKLKHSIKKGTNYEIKHKKFILNYNKWFSSVISQNRNEGPRSTTTKLTAESAKKPRRRLSHLIDL